MAITTRRRRILIQRQLLLIQLYYQLTLNAKKKYKQKRWWVHPIWRKRSSEGHYRTLMKTMRRTDNRKFSNFTRMEPTLFDKLLELVRPYIVKNPPGRKPISPGERLALTLRFLATGDSFDSMAYAFRLGKTTTHNIVKETCQVLWDVLQPLYLPQPTENNWSMAEAEYRNRWNFPTCCGAVDGKHVMIQQPSNSGTLYYNYKGFNSIVLMAVVDAKYRFLVVDVGGYGSHSDGGIFKSSSFGQAVENNQARFPPAVLLPNTNIASPHVLVGDDAFQLLPNFMKPYSRDGRLTNSQIIFNYRLSRARRCSENAFGILATRWRVFRRPLILKPSNVDKVIKACVVLHNFLMKEEEKTKQKRYCPNDFADYVDKNNGNIIKGKWHDKLRNDPAKGFEKLKPTSARNYSREVAIIRDNYAKYFVKEGNVEWQWDLKGVKRPDN